jgi:voltage-gated sodium channel type II alpha
MIMMKAGQAQTISRQVKPPDEEYKIPIWDLIHSKKFNDAILYTIVANTIVMASNQYQLNHVFRKIFKVLNMIFSIIFNTEMILKLLALENQYFWFGWNLFDMFIVISADIGIILDILELSKSFSTAVTILRAFRIMRIVRIL